MIKLYIQFWSENLKERDVSEDIIKTDLDEMDCQSVEWINADEDRFQWRLCNTVWIVGSNNRKFLDQLSMIFAKKT
jgi:hypothetical protein